jgi:hypothetical protein
MLTIGGGTSKNCQRCAGRNDLYARFCVHCGEKTGTYFSSECPNCGSTDLLNGPFCVSCGAATSVGKIKVPTASGFSWSKKTKGGTLYNKLTESLEQEASDLNRGPGRLRFLAIASGVICGALLALGLSHSETFQRMATRLEWPMQGLVIYSDEPYANMNLKAIDSNLATESVSFDGSLGASGSIALKAIPAGSYLLTLSSAGKQSLVQPVTVSQGHPTIVGFPERLKLPHQTEM